MSRIRHLPAPIRISGSVRSAVNREEVFSRLLPCLDNFFNAAERRRKIELPAAAFITRMFALFHLGTARCRRNIAQESLARKPARAAVSMGIPARLSPPSGEVVDTYVIRQFKAEYRHGPNKSDATENREAHRR